MTSKRRSRSYAWVLGLRNETHTWARFEPNDISTWARTRSSPTPGSSVYAHGLTRALIRRSGGQGVASSNLASPINTFHPSDLVGPAFNRHSSAERSCERPQRSLIGIAGCLPAPSGRLSQFPEVDPICVDSQGEIPRARLGFPTARAASTRIFSHVGRGIPCGGGDNDARSNITEAQAHRRGCLALARSGRAD